MTANPFLGVLLHWIGGLAAASFYIYLTHFLPLHLLVFYFHSQNVVAALALSLPLGVATQWAVLKATEWLGVLFPRGGLAPLAPSVSEGE